MDKFAVKIKEYKDAKKGDILCFDGKVWKPASVDDIFFSLVNSDEILKSRLEGLERKFNDLLEAYNKDKAKTAELLKGVV